MATVNDLLGEGESRMKKAVEALKRELGVIRTGRANPALVEHIQVDYYGVPTPLGQMASIAAPEARLLVVQPWDRSALPAIEKAILKSDVGLTPASDGNVIRLAVPLLTEERRRELVRLVRRKVEDGRVAVRNIRRDINDRLRAMEKNKELSQDDSRRGQERLQKLTDAYVAQVDGLGNAKESEVMEV